MSATVEQLYAVYDTIQSNKGATETEKSERSIEYHKILEATRDGDSAVRRLASQFIASFFKEFMDDDSIKSRAIDALIDVCQDDNSQTRMQGVKDLCHICRLCPDQVAGITDVLAQLLQTSDHAELSIVQKSLSEIMETDPKVALQGIFHQIIDGEPIVRERCIRFLVNKFHTLPEKKHSKEMDEFAIAKIKQALDTCNGVEFVMLITILSNIKSLQTLTGRQSIVDMIVKQAGLEKEFTISDAEDLERIVICSQQALPLLSLNVHSTKLVSFHLTHILPNLELVEDAGMQLEAIKLLAELSTHCGDMENWESLMDTLLQALKQYLPLPAEKDENGENGEPSANLQYTEVESLLYALHQIGRKHESFLTNPDHADRLKDLKARLQFFALGTKAASKKLQTLIKGLNAEQMKEQENKVRIIALKTMGNIETLIKDFFHTPPMYKAQITLSWKPPKTEKRKSDSGLDASPPKKAAGMVAPRRTERATYQPPTGRYSDRAGAPPSYRGARPWQRGGRGRGRGRGGGYY